VLVSGYREHVPVKELARHYGISRQTVNAVLRRHWVEPHQLGLSPAEVADATQLYRDGWSLAKLAQKFGVDGMTVRRYLLLAGVVMREPNDRHLT
jgi:lambda repressor-like predicted transcriptional regulator